jgi:hypothetical protein
MEWRERISVDPDVRRGRGCIKGRRIAAAVGLDNLAAGLSAEEARSGHRPASPGSCRGDGDRSPRPVEVVEADADGVVAGRPALP